MANTKAQEVIDSFESTFADKQELPYELEIAWLKKAVARYSLELDEINYNAETEEFDRQLSGVIIMTLGVFMKQFYQERQVALANKRVSIVGKDLSIDGGNGTKTAEKAHLAYAESQSIDWVENQKTTAYA